MFADGAQVRARDGESKWALRVALLEAIDISSMDDKMLMEELLNNTAWSSTRVLQTDSSEMFLVMYGLVSLVLIGTITLNISSILSCLSRRRRSTRSTTWRCFGRQQACLHAFPLLPFSSFPCILSCLSRGFSARVQGRRQWQAYGGDVLAQLVDLGVFDGFCEEVETAESTWKFNTAQF